MFTLYVSDIFKFEFNLVDVNITAMTIFLILGFWTLKIVLSWHLDKMFQRDAFGFLCRKVFKKSYKISYRKVKKARLAQLQREKFMSDDCYNLENYNRRHQII